MGNFAYLLTKVLVPEDKPGDLRGASASGGTLVQPRCLTEHGELKASTRIA